MSQWLTYRVERVVRSTVTVSINVSETDLDKLTHAELEAKAISEAGWFPTNFWTETEACRADLLSREERID